jgi:hypothetical protein
VLSLIETECDRQVDKFGVQHLPNGTSQTRARTAEEARRMVDRDARNGDLTWFKVLMEEYYEASSEVEWKKLRAELSQVAAVCVSWILDGDERERARTEAANGKGKARPKKGKAAEQLPLPFEG